MLFKIFKNLGVSIWNHPPIRFHSKPSIIHHSTFIPNYNIQTMTMIQNNTKKFTNIKQRQWKMKKKNGSNFIQLTLSVFTSSLFLSVFASFPSSSLQNDNNTILLGFSVTISGFDSQIRS